MIFVKSSQLNDLRNIKLPHYSLYVYQPFIPIRTYKHEANIILSSINKLSI